MITVAGSINLDLVARVPHLPRAGETVLGGALDRFHGGKGANQAVAAARLGASVRFFGAVGSDDFAAELELGLRTEGVDVSGLARVNGASGTALISVANSGENCISVLPGANRDAPLPPPGLRPALTVLQLEIPMATVLAWARAGAGCGGRVVLNAAPMAPLPPELLGCVDVLVVNRGELAQLDASPSVRDAAAQVARRGPRSVVVTLGGEGCAAWHDGAWTTWPGEPVAVVDTTGAGDTFVGALAAALDNGHPFHEAVARANAAAALSCARHGARSGMPTRAELDAHRADARPGNAAPLGAR